MREERTSPPPWPALIVIHPITGLDEMMMQRTRDFAAEGYLAVAPDIYSNDHRYLEHEPKNIERAAHIWLERDDAKRQAHLDLYDAGVQAQIQAAREWVQARPTATYVDVVTGCYKQVRARSDVRSIGSIGYCMGGRLTAELAGTGADLGAAVIYYGTGTKPEAIPNIKCPVQGHYAVTDGFIYSVYDADHGFGEPSADVYNPAAAQLAATRAKAFLAKNL